MHWNRSDRWVKSPLIYGSSLTPRFVWYQLGYICPWDGNKVTVGPLHDFLRGRRREEH